MKKPLIFAVLAMLFLSSSAHAISNPFGLTTDEQLESTSGAIESLWNSAESGSFIGVADIEIKFKVFKNPNETGAIVISSGRTESYIKYKELIYSLFTSGYTVYIHDHRGQGFSGRMVNSDTQMGHVWNFDDYVTDLKSLYDLKVSPNNHKNVFLLAHSMGGGIATLYMEKHKNDFRVAALSSPMHQPDTGVLGGAACSGAAITTTIRDFFISMFGWEPRYAVGQGPYKKTAFSPNSEKIMTHSEVRYLAIQELYDNYEEVKIGGVSSHWLANACNASRRLLNNAGEIEIPVLVLQAEKDIAVTAEGQNKFCKTLESSSGQGKCKTGEPIVIRGAFHEMFIESDAYRIPAVTKILSFFKEQTI